MKSHLLLLALGPMGILSVCSGLQLSLIVYSSMKELPIIKSVHVFIYAIIFKISSLKILIVTYCLSILA